MLPKPRLKPRQKDDGTSFHIHYARLGADGKALRYSNGNVKERTRSLEGARTEEEAEIRFADFLAGWAGALPAGSAGVAVSASRKVDRSVQGAYEAYARHQRKRIAAKRRGRGGITEEHGEEVLRHLRVIVDSLGYDLDRQQPAMVIEAYEDLLHERAADDWGHACIKKNMLFWRQFSRFSAARKIVVLPDITAGLRPSDFAEVSRFEQLVLPPDEIMAVVRSAWEMVEFRHAQRRKKETPHKQKWYASAKSKALAVSHAALMGLPIGDCRSQVGSEYGKEQGHVTLARYRQKTGVRLDIPVMGLLGDIAREYVAWNAPDAVCPNLPTSESSAHKGLQTIVRNADIGRKVGWHTLRHSFGTLVRTVYSNDYGTYGRLMGHVHGSPMCLPPKLRKKSGATVGERYDHADFDRCLKVVRRLEALFGRAA